MIKSRLDRYYTISDTVLKLAGYRNLYAQDVLEHLVSYVSPMENFYMKLIDKIGLYDNRIYFLYDTVFHNLILFF